VRCVPTETNFKCCTSAELSLANATPKTHMVLSSKSLMSNSQSSCRRKRLCVERPSYKPNGTPPPPPERSPTCNKDPDEWIYPAQFWDDLSKIWLTPNALRELDRRNQQSKSNQKRRPPQACRLFTLTTSQSNRTTLSTDDILRHYTKKKLKDMKWFAMFGGPDLRGLRGVCILSSLLPVPRIDESL
jgi:hypothetical protein